MQIRSDQRIISTANEKDENKTNEQRHIDQPFAISSEQRIVSGVQMWSTNESCSSISKTYIYPITCSPMLKLNKIQLWLWYISTGTSRNAAYHSADRAPSSPASTYDPPIVYHWYRALTWYWSFIISSFWLTIRNKDMVISHHFDIWIFKTKCCS